MKYASHKSVWSVQCVQAPLSSRYAESGVASDNSLLGQDGFCITHVVKFSGAQQWCQDSCCLICLQAHSCDEEECQVHYCYHVGDGFSLLIDKAFLHFALLACGRKRGFLSAFFLLYCTCKGTLTALVIVRRCQSSKLCYSLKKCSRCNVAAAPISAGESNCEVLCEGNFANVPKSWLCAEYQSDPRVRLIVQCWVFCKYVN